MGSGFNGELAVSGAATLAGTPAIQTQSGYLPRTGTRVTIAWSPRSASFGTVTGAQLSGEHWAIGSSAVALAAKPG